jgi:predicted aspartyl protease
MPDLFSTPPRRRSAGFRLVTTLVVWWWVGIGLTPSVPAQVAASLQQRGYETVTLRRTAANHWYVVGRVEERRRSCLVDTGWSFTTVTTNTAAALARTNRIAELKLGRIAMTNVPVRAADLRVNGRPTSYDVVLGADFLIQHQAWLDCGAGRLYLRQTPLPAAERIQLEEWLQQHGWVAVRLTRRSPPTWSLATLIQNHPVELLVDNGATWSCLDPATAQAANLQVLPSLHQISGPAAGGKRNFSVAQVRDWRWEDRIISSRSVAVLALRDWGLGPEGELFPDVGGILGGAELLAARVLVDCAGDKLWIPRRRR